MFSIDPARQGDVAFYERLYGTGLIYLSTVLLWERVLRAPLPEWKYVLIVFLGASAFWINHYFQRSGLCLGTEPLQPGFPDRLLPCVREAVAPFPCVTDWRNVDGPRFYRGLYRL